MLNYSFTVNKHHITQPLKIKELFGQMIRITWKNPAAKKKRKCCVQQQRAVIWHHCQESVGQMYLAFKCDRCVDFLDSLELLILSGLFC